MLYEKLTEQGIEVLYDDREETKNKEQNSPYNGIKFIKLTELGKYLLGITDSYEFEQEKSTMEIVLSEKELIMSVTGSDRRKEIVISKIAEQTGTNLFKVNNKTLFAGCSKKEDVKSFLEIMDQSINYRLVEITDKEREKADMLIVPDVEKFSTMDFAKVVEIIAAGENVAREKIEEIRKYRDEDKFNKIKSKRLKKLCAIYIDKIEVTGTKRYNKKHNTKSTKLKCSNRRK
jgi:hypothetical protein